LTAVALAPDIEDPAIAATIAVMLDLPVLLGLQRIGLDRSEAARRISEIALAWIAGHDAVSRNGRKPNEDEG
jgi:hypothetical protein